MWWSNLERVWRWWFVPSANESEESIDEELMFHLRSLIDENLAKGMPTDAAWLEARLRFGSLRRYADECRGVFQRGQAMLQKLSAVGLLVLCALVGWVAIEVRALRGEQQLARIEAELRFAASEQRSVGPLAELTTFAGDQQERYARRLGSNEQASAERCDVQGVVVDHSGKPLPDANVLVVLKTWPGGRYLEDDLATTSDAEGRFRLANVLPTVGHREILVAAVKHGHALTSTYQAKPDGDPLAVEPIVLKLEDAANFTVLVHDRVGRPAAHARVVPAFRRTAAGEEHIIYLTASRPIRTVSDDYGRAALGCFQRGDEGEVWIQVPGEEWERRAITIPADGDAITLSSGEVAQETGVVDAEPEQ